MHSIPTTDITLQAAIAHAVLSPEAPVPREIEMPHRGASSNRFDVYRNNVVLGLINALGTRYPVVRRLLWDEAFNAIARLFISASPPRSPVLHEYGQDFPDFVREFGSVASCDYVADVAELESARVRAYHSVDAEPLTRAAFAALEPGEFVSMRVHLHPSVTLLNSNFPIVTVWESQQAGNDGYVREWKKETALIARPSLDVEVWRLPEGGFEFLGALHDGDTVARAIERATLATAGFDLTACLTLLIGSGIAVGIQPDPS
jgi:hypothetical protein